MLAGKTAGRDAKKTKMKARPRYKGLLPLGSKANDHEKANKKSEQNTLESPDPMCTTWEKIRRVPQALETPWLFSLPPLRGAALEAHLCPAHARHPGNSGRTAVPSTPCSSPPGDHSSPHLQDAFARNASHECSEGEGNGIKGVAERCVGAFIVHRLKKNNTKTTHRLQDSTARTPTTQHNQR